MKRLWTFLLSTPVFHRKTSVQAEIGLQLNTATKVENSIPALVYPETAKEISHCNAAKWFTMWNEAGWFLVLVVENSGDVFLAAPVQIWLNSSRSNKSTVLSITEEKIKSNK